MSFDEDFDEDFDEEDFNLFGEPDGYVPRNESENSDVDMSPIVAKVPLLPESPRPHQDPSWKDKQRAGAVEQDPFDLRLKNLRDFIDKQIYNKLDDSDLPPAFWGKIDEINYLHLPSLAYGLYWMIGEKEGNGGKYLKDIENDLAKSKSSKVKLRPASIIRYKRFWENMLSK